LKRGAVCDADDDGRKTIVVFSGVAHDLSNGGSVVGFNATTEGKRKQFFAQSTNKKLGAFEEPVLQFGDAFEGFSVGQASRGIDRMAVFEKPPAPDGVVVFKNETDGIDYVVAACAGGVGAVLGEAFAHWERQIDFVVFEIGYIGGRGNDRICVWSVGLPMGLSFPAVRRLSITVGRERLILLLVAVARRS